MASESAILTFLELLNTNSLTKGNKDKVKKLMPSVKNEIKTVNKLQIHEKGKEAIRLLEKIVKFVQLENFVLAKTECDKVKQGFNTYIKKKLNESKEVACLPDDVGKNIPLKQRQSSGKRPKTREAASETNVRNGHPKNPSSIPSVATDAPQPQSTKRENGDAAGEEHDMRNIHSRKQKRNSDSTPIRVPDKVEIDSELFEEDREPIREDKKTNQERTQKRPKENNVYSYIMQANDPRRVKNMFESLHENEWVDAFDVLRRLAKVTEAEVANQLIEIVKMAYKFCHDEADSQLELIKKEMSCIVALGTPDNHQKKSRDTRDKDIKNNPGDIDLIKQYRLLHADHALDNLHSKFKAHCQMGKGFRYRIDQRALQNGDFVKYLDKCIDMTWLMCLQDPPTSLASTDRFIPSLYKSPPKNYRDVDYIAWPALIFRDEVLALGEVTYKRVR